MRLANKFAVITGGASGIGKTVAELFAEHGANLALVDVSSNVNSVADDIQRKASENNWHIKVSSHICDVSNSAQVEDLFKQIREKFEGKVPNVVVNCAGIFGMAKVLELKEEDFDRVISINLKGTFLISQCAVKHLIEQITDYSETSNPLSSYASIINIASIAGSHGSQGLAHYSASKAGVEGLTKVLAKELGKHKIRCNAVLPGVIDTPMANVMTDEQRARINALNSLGRCGLPIEVARLILFLASDESTYITGSSIAINGGQMA